MKRTPIRQSPAVAGRGWKTAALAGLATILLGGTLALGGEAAAPTPGEEQPAAGNHETTPPRDWHNTVKAFAAALAISITAFATAMTQWRIGSAGVGALAENPKLFASILVYLVIPETMVILGFVIAALILL